MRNHHTRLGLFGTAMAITGVLASCTTGGGGGGGTTPPPESVPPVTRITSSIEQSNVRSRPSISADGNVVVFDSDANLVGSDNNQGNGKTDVFVLVRSTGIITRVTGGNDRSGGASITGNGRYVVFNSQANDLVPGDNNNTDDVFVYDRVLLTTRDITATATSWSDSGSVSDDGHWAVVGTSNNYDGLPSPSLNNSPRNIFLLDLTGVAAPLRITNGNDDSESPVISGDGSRVVFQSRATDLDLVDANGNASDIFTWDRVGGALTRITNGTISPDPEGPTSEFPTISSDGTHIAFHSAASDLLPSGDSNGSFDVFEWIQGTGIVRITDQASGRSGAPSISTNGQHIVFISEGTGLTPGPDANGLGVDYFVWDASDGHITRLTNGDSIGIGNDGEGISWPSVSDSGKVAVFGTTATNLGGTDNNGHGSDMYISVRP